MVLFICKFKLPFLRNNNILNKVFSKLEIANILVDKKHRKIGVGSILLQAALKKIQKGHSVDLLVRPKRLRLIKWYESHGFKKEKIVKDKIRMRFLR